MIFGIELSEIKSPPIMLIGRWKVYKIRSSPNVKLTSPSINYQINGNSLEKIIVRFFLNESMRLKLTKYYYLSSTDKELAFLIMSELQSRIIKKYPMSSDFKQINMYYP